MSRQQMIDDLARSGLTTADIKKLKLKYLTPAQTLAAYKKKYTAYEIPYFDIDGKVKPFKRVRFLEDVYNNEGKLQKYTQPPRSAIHLYYPPLLAIPTDTKVARWKTVAKDTSYEIIITEGEKKAAKLCAEGLPCIGLGGVWSFQSKTTGQKLISDFDVIDWSDRHVHIIFDSDFVDKPEIKLATDMLAKRLTDAGAVVHTGCMPADSPEEKIGIDDYLVDHTLNDFIHEVLSITQDYTRGVELMQMNTEVALIDNIAAFYKLDNDSLYTRDQLLNVMYADKTILTDDGETQIAKEWIKWTGRRRHSALVYKPAEPEVTDTNEFNLWKGYGVEPVEGNIEPFNALLDYLFKDDEKFKQWFLQWLAYPLQHPSAKLFTAVLLWSHSHGTGKSFLGYIIGDIYGSNFAEINQDDLQGDFNSWSVNKQFIMGEEITGSDKRSHADKIKGMVSRQKIRVKEKYKPEYFIKDCINYLFTSNHHNALYIEETDRRYAVHEVTGIPMDEHFYKRVHEWRNEGGAAYLFNYLLNEVDVSNFNPAARAPDTSAKDNMLEASASELDLWCRQLRDYPDEVLLLDNLQIDRDLCTSDELFSLFNHQNGYDIHKHSVQAFRNALNKAGFRAYKPIYCESKTRRLIAVRNVEYWNDATNKERVDNYTKSVVARPDKKKKFRKDNVVSLNDKKKGK